VFSRGWSEIYTGENAIKTGGYYIKPKLNGTYSMDVSYNHKVPLSVGIPSIWNSLNEGGVSVGIMNIPSSSPADEVNGFMVGGAGGGINKVDGVPRALCDSDDTQELLNELGYIIDLRIGPGGVKTIHEMFDKIDKIAEIRADAFIELFDKHSPDFGFLCYRTIATAQYVCMSEIEAMIVSEELNDLGIGGESSKNILNPVQKRILQHFQILDSALERVYNHIQPDDFIICADHGIANYKFNANADAFLEKYGYLSRQSKHLRFARGVVNKLWRDYKTKLPNFLRRKIQQQSAVTKAKLLPINFAPSSSRAFGYWYLPGIFINDKKRFGGPVSDKELDELVDEICVDFNQDELAKQHNMTAIPYRRIHQDSHWSEHMPDILIDKPDEVFFIGKGDFVSQNPNYGPGPDNIAGLTDMNSGQKSQDVIFEASEGVTKLIKDGDPHDLRLVHHLIARYFNLDK
jgi:predicted AlkP superfamily phosphohydrolase/phosphomutase